MNHGSRHDYSIHFQFDIADGYIVVFEASAVNEQYGEHFKITDTLNNVHEYRSPSVRTNEKCYSESQVTHKPCMLQQVERKLK